MSTGYKNRKKTRRAALRNTRDGKGPDAERYGTIANQIKRGALPRFTWWRGAKQLVPVNEKGEAIQAKARTTGLQYTKRWKQYKTVYLRPLIKSSLGALFGKRP